MGKMQERKKDSMTEYTEKQNRVEGYFTVEASLVLPIVIGCVLFVLCFLLYFYNRCLMDQDTAMLSVYAINEYQGDIQKMGEGLKAWKQENLTEKYVGFETGQLQITKGQNRLRLQRDGFLLTDFVPFHATSAYENRILRPSFFLRLCRRIENEKDGKTTS